MATIGKDISTAVKILSKGDLVAIPTETVYGLAANALDPAAVTKIFQTKKRPEFNPLIVHLPGKEKLETYTQEIPDHAHQLIEKFWPGPLTLVLKKRENIPYITTSGLETVAVRCPNHKMTLELLGQLDFPLAAPSANLFGKVSPTKPLHVQEQLGDHIEYILDGGQCTMGIESTIIGFEADEPVIYRWGSLGQEDIESVVGKMKSRTQSTSNPKAPGQLKSHYAPKQKMIVGVIAELLQEYPAHCTGILSFQKDYHSPFQVILSPSGNLDEAAQNFFQALHSLEKMEIKNIITEYVPDQGIGRAINDRLMRASAET